MQENKKIKLKRQKTDYDIQKKAGKKIVELVKQLSLTDPNSDYIKGKTQLQQNTQIEPVCLDSKDAFDYLAALDDLYRMIPVVEQDGRYDDTFLFITFRKQITEWILHYCSRLGMSSHTFHMVLSLINQQVLVNKDKIRRIKDVENLTEEENLWFENLLIASIIICSKFQNVINHLQQQVEQKLCMACDEQRQEKIQKVEKKIFRTMNYNMGFQTYRNAMDYIMIKNCYLIEEFKFLKTLTEFVFFRTIGSESQFLVYEMDKFCSAVLIYIFRKVKMFFYASCKNQKLREDVFFEIRNQFFQHEKEIIQKSGYSRNELMEVVQKIHIQLKYYGQTEWDNKYPNIGEQIKSGRFIFYNNLED